MKIDKIEISLKNGKSVFQYSLNNDNGIEVKILSLGGIITNIMVPDSEGNLENIVLGWKDINDYLEDSSYAGAIIGRNSGRIADGRIKIGEALYETYKNNGLNTLHGGEEGFNKKIWITSTKETEKEISLKLETYSKDGDEGFPGNIKVIVEYSLNNENEFSIRYYGVSDKETILNVTNHSYFNLSGDVKRNILDEKLTIKGNKVGLLRSDSAFTGELIDVKGTPFDFNKSKRIGEDIDKEDKQLRLGNGYDHPWILSKSGGYDIKLEDEISGRKMEVYTDRKGVVIYTTNFPENKKLYNGDLLKKNDGICFETQSLPIGENYKFIEDSLLKEDEEYKAVTIFKFYW